MQFQELPDIVNYMTYLAVSISAPSVLECLDQIRQAHQGGAEMVELRTDYLKELSSGSVKELIEAVHKCKLPVIVTCRDQAQGGAQPWPQETRTEILAGALKAGANYIDCEFSNFARAPVQQVLLEALNKNVSSQLILSAHDFSIPFKNLNELYESIVTLCPDAIPKLVYQANHLNDCFAALDLLYDKDRDAVVLAMGQDGMITRILAKKFGSFLTFGCLDSQSATAPGQIPLSQMKDLFRWDSIDHETEVYGLIGNPVGHSLSPAIYNACFEKDQINALYLPLRLEGDQSEFEEFMHHVVRRPWLGAGGFSVTIPHKTHALVYANHEGNYVENLPELIGAVNTLKVGFNGIVSGYNTDYSGAMDALTESMGITSHDLHNLKVADIGAGGAARAVVAGLSDVAARITIYNRTISKAQSLANEFNCKSLPLEQISQSDAAVFINCTSIGMHPHIDQSPAPKEIFNSEQIVFDTVYNPIDTLLLQQAGAAGARTVNGAEMFIRQAITQYRLFMGSDPDEQIIRETVLDRLAS